LLLKSKQSLPFDFYFFSGQFFYWSKNNKKDLLKSTFNRFLSHEKNALVLVFLNSFSFSLPFLWKQGGGLGEGRGKERLKKGRVRWWSFKFGEERIYSLFIKGRPLSV